MRSGPHHLLLLQSLQPLLPSLFACRPQSCFIIQFWLQTSMIHEGGMMVSFFSCSLQLLQTGFTRQSMWVAWANLWWSIDVWKSNLSYGYRKCMFVISCLSRYIGPLNCVYYWVWSSKFFSLEKWSNFIWTCVSLVFILWSSKHTPINYRTCPIEERIKTTPAYLHSMRTRSILILMTRVQAW